MFSYPDGPHVRRHGPCGYLDYKSFKPWLRDEFSFRCVYCLARETWYPNGADSFGVEHQKPKIRHRELECDYENLLYACNRCNAWKQEKDLVDPASVGLAQHVRVNQDGTIEGLTPDGKFLIGILELDQEDVTAFRKKFIALYESLDANVPEEAELLREFFGFPRDLPDLAALRPPEGNTRPDGIARSFGVQRSAGTLPPFF